MTIDEDGCELRGDAPEVRGRRVVLGSRSFWREVVASRVGGGVVVLRCIRCLVVPYVYGTRRRGRARRTRCRIKMIYARREEDEAR